MFQGSKIWHYITNGFVIVLAASIFTLLIFVGFKVYNTIDGSTQEVREVSEVNTDTEKKSTAPKKTTKRKTKADQTTQSKTNAQKTEQKSEPNNNEEKSTALTGGSIGSNPSAKTDTRTSKAMKELELLESMVLLTGSEFVMGNDKGRSDEKPAHTVSLNSFFVDKYEVTVQEFRKFCEATNHEMPVQPSWNKDDHPVVNVTFHDAQAYGKWKGKRLPTEAEWEYMARGGDPRADYPWKNGDDSRAFANFKGTGGRDKWEKTSPVGSFAPNKFGVYDIGGNVREWCSDWYDRGYSGNDTVNPKGPDSGTRKVIRGGSWDYEEHFMKITNRDKSTPSNKSYNIGFRCVKSAN